MCDQSKAMAQPDNIDYNAKMAYSLDFRRKVLSVREKEGLTIAEVAVRFDVGVASVVPWIKHVERKPQGFRKRKIDLEVLHQDILDYPDAYQYERAKSLGVAQNAIFLALRKLGVTYKKNSDAPQSGRKRTAHPPG
jgi:transposase